MYFQRKNILLYLINISFLLSADAENITHSSTQLHHEFQTTGQIQSTLPLSIKTPFAGRIKEIFVHDGQIIQKGEPLFAMDDETTSTQIQSTLKQQKAKQDATEVKMHQAKEQLTLINDSIHTLTAALERAVYRQDDEESHSLSQQIQHAKGKRDQLETQYQLYLQTLNQQRHQIENLQLNQLKRQSNQQNNLVLSKVSGTISHVRPPSHRMLPNKSPVCRITPTQPYEIKVTLPKRLAYLFKNHHHWVAQHDAHTLTLNSYELKASSDKIVAFFDYDLPEAPKTSTISLLIKDDSSH